jgi:translation elongation factor EF-Tu-like GTPase
MRSKDFKDTKRAEKIENAFYAMDRALKARQLMSIVPYKSKFYYRYQDLSCSIAEQAAEMMLKAFAGEVNGRKVKSFR